MQPERTRWYSGLLACVPVLLIGCSHDWDAYVPQPSGSTSAGTGPGGAGGTAGASVSSSGSGAAPAGTGGLGGAGGGAGGSPPLLCGDMKLLSDDFSEATLSGDWSKSTNGTATIAPTGGVLVGTLPAMSAASSSATAYTKRRYDIHGERAWVSVPVMVNTATTAGASFSVLYDSTNYVQIYQKQGTVHFTKRVAGTTVELGSVLYDPAMHLFWQFREDAGTLFWETSSDGMAFATQGQWPTDDVFPLDEIRVQLGVSASGGEIAPGEAHFDDLNGGVVPTGKWCPPGMLTDDFEDGVQGHAWVRSYANSGTNVSETGGELVLVPGTNMTGTCAYVSSKAYDLTGNAAVVEVPEMVDTTTNTDAYLRLENDSNNGLSFKQTAGSLGCRVEKNGNIVVVATTLYSPTSHRWWRIREDQGTLYCETAPDGKTWTEHGQAPKDTLDVTAFDVFLGASTSTMIANPGAVHFDNYNLPPP